ncbi:hypothetical protein WH96_11310 [Kiloniella spongiae]|uniref:Integrase catalytic domain-containing protein n=1 Tax=Kiloniella spongiae TaxID=1489064 RepID=A0A0H2MD78_9PROT|nr:hypothetical protein WH96_11310 [Kiloniella spongiae]
MTVCKCGGRKIEKVEWHYIAPDMPMQNGFVESFNGRLLTNYRHARELIGEWEIDYNIKRPYTSLMGLTPNEYAIRPKID